MLFHIRSCGPVSSYAYQRLRLLQTKFELYTMDPQLTWSDGGHWDLTIVSRFTGSPLLFFDLRSLVIKNHKMLWIPVIVLLAYCFLIICLDPTPT